jgi:hypothetical protein
MREKQSKEMNPESVRQRAGQGYKVSLEDVTGRSRWLHRAQPMYKAGEPVDCSSV